MSPALRALRTCAILALTMAVVAGCGSSSSSSSKHDTKAKSKADSRKGYLDPADTVEMNAALQAESAAWNDVTVPAALKACNDLSARLSQKNVAPKTAVACHEHEAARMLAATTALRNAAAKLSTKGANPACRAAVDKLNAYMDSLVASWKLVHDDWIAWGKGDYATGGKAAQAFTAAGATRSTLGPTITATSSPCFTAKDKADARRKAAAEAKAAKSKASTSKS
jgi:hypothetical protein